MDNKELDKLEALAKAATPGRWMRLFGERTVYDRMEDGCRGNAIVRADQAYGAQDAANLDFIAAANPAAILELIALARAGLAAHTGQKAEPVAQQSYSYRTRPLDAVGRVNGEWSDWKECTREQYIKGIPHTWPRDIEYRGVPVSAAPAAPTGCELCNSEYGFSCDGKSGQCGAAPTATAEPSLDADEMARLRRLIHALGMDGSMNASDEQVRGLLFTALGQAAGKIERAAPIAPEAGESLHDAIMNIPCRYTSEVAWDSNDADKPKRCYQEGHHDARHAAAKLVNERIAAMSAAPAQPKDTTKGQA